MLQIIVFNVRDGQTIFFYPKNKPEYMTLVDIHKTNDFSPVEFISKKYPGMGLYKLILTNYDYDHFSGIEDLLQKVHISTTEFPENISSNELKKIKPKIIANIIEKIFSLKDKCDGFNKCYVLSNINKYRQSDCPYQYKTFFLTQEELRREGLSIDNTNYLSQVVFIDYGLFRICIPGDLEEQAWEIMLRKKDFQEMLRGTEVLIAPHHGRKNGYCESIFDYARPDVVIISDKKLEHETQDAMAQRYAKHVAGDGILFNNFEKRKVLTTRNDGHILINADNDGSIRCFNF